MTYHIVGLDVAVTTQQLRDWIEREKQQAPTANFKVSEVVVYIDGEKREFTFDEFKKRLGFTTKEA